MVCRGAGGTELGARPRAYQELVQEEMELAYSLFGEQNAASVVDSSGRLF